MKKHSRNTRGLGAWVLGGMASALVCVSAFGQYAANQSAITINDNAPASPYPSVIDLTKSNIVGNLEKVTVTLNNVKHGYANDVGVLLVAPDGSNVVLMRNAGGGQPINGATLTFDDSGTALPQFSAISSGTWAPADFDPTSNFLGSAPAKPYGAGLSGLIGATPNGKWSLYVEDDSPGSSGTIDSWTLNLYTTPLISLATNYVNLNENGSSSNVSFTLQDSSTSSGFSVSFGGPATNNFVTAAGSTSGLNGTVTLTPKLNVFGTNTLTVIVSDGLGSVQSNLTVAILHVNQAPTITITNASVTTVAGAVSPVINAVVADVDPDNPASSLSVSVSSSNTNIVDPAEVFFDPANSGGLRTFTVVPNGTATGSATLTFTVMDAGKLTGTATLPVTVNPVANPIYASTNLLGLSASGTTNSSIAVSNISGAIGNLSVAVSGLKTVAGDNLSLALVPPGGTPITLMANAGSSGPNTFAQLVFSAATGGAALPASDTITAVNLKAAGLASLVGTTPNGTWKLWATNGGAAAQISGGWVLSLQVGPAIATTVPKITMPEESSTNISFTITDIDGAITNASDVTITSADPTLVTVTGATFDTGSGIGSATFNSILGGPQFGKTTVTVTAKDNHNFTASLTYDVTVTFVNHAPTMSFILKQVTRAGTPLGPVPFTVSDIDLTIPPQTLTVTAKSSDQKILPNNNILLQGSGGNRTFTFFPVGTNNGDVQVTFSVDDGSATNSQTFILTVQPQGNPLFVNLGSISVPANANASPYPSTIGVSNLLGTISKVDVTLFDISHTAPDNMNVLLVSPSGTKVLLMGHAGGSNPSGDAVIEFSDDAASPLSDTAQIISGIYKPSSYGTVATFPSTPAGTINTTLAAFNGLNGTNANGLWSLYIVDDGLGKGLIVSGWQLSIQTDPFVSQIADVTLKENDKTLQIPVSLGDDQPGVNITASAVSANPGVVTAAFEAGSGGTRILDITPVPYQIGSNILVTVTAQSGAASSSTNFHVTVYGVNLPPVLSSIGNVSTPATVQSPATLFTAWDPQDKALSVSATSSDTKLIPNGNVLVTGPTTVGTTNGHNILQYGVQVRSADADVTGTAVITVVVTDSVGQAANATFNATITKGLVFLSADGPLTIPEGYPIASNATPYPSIVSVSNLDGLVTSAKVTLIGFSHGFPQDVDVLLVSPDDKVGVVLMAHVGGGTPVSNLRLNFDDAGAALTTSALSSGTFAPTDLASSLKFASPAPTSGYVTNLAALKNVNPNGNWKLYVMDDSFPVGGSLAQWMLTLETGPAFDLTTLGPQRTPENTTKIVQFGLLDDSADPASLVVTAATNGVVAPTNVLNLIAGVTVTNNGGATRTLIITPSANLPSTITNVDATTTVMLTVTDTNGNQMVTSVPITVSYGNQAPVVSAATNLLLVLENSSITTTFTVSDVDSTLNMSNLVVASTDGGLIPNSTNGFAVSVSTNTVVPGTSGTVTVKVTPTPYVFGTNTITVSITDGTTVTTSTVTVGVVHVPQPPIITGLPASVSTVAGSPTAPIPFTVASLEGVPASSLTVTATSGDQTLVPNANIVLSGAADARTIQLTPLGTVSGTDTITMLVGDGKLTNTFHFDLKITAPPSTLFGNGQVASVVGNATNVNSSPYPMTFDVTNLVGAIYNVSLELRGFSNSTPAQLDALLVAPDGTSVMLSSGGGGATAVSGLDLVFDDSGADLSTIDPLVSGTYHPTYVTKRLLPLPAPQSGYASRMAAFGSVPANKVNGTWSLYLNSLTLGNFGKVNGGAYLTIVTKPAISITTTTPVIIPENGSSNVSFTVSDSVTAVSNLTVTASASDNRALLPTSSVTITGPTPATSGNFVALFQPIQYQNGNVNITLTATRSDGASTSVAVPVTVPATNFPPIFVGRLSDTTTLENQTTNVQFVVSDPDTALSNLVVKAVSANQAVIGDTNIVFSGSTNNVLNGLPANSGPQLSTLTLNLTPNPYVVNNATIWVIIDDNTANGHNIVSNSFTFNVLPVVYPPTITPPADQTVSSGGTTPPLGFQVNSLNQPAPSLSVTAVSSDQTLVKNANITILPVSGTSVPNRTVVVKAESGVKGTATITLTVNDTVNNKSASASFKVSVLPSSVLTFANANGIIINDNSAGTPYPSSNIVSGLSGTIGKLSVTVSNFAHHYPADVGLLLVGPNGQKVVLMNKAGGGNPVTNVSLTFDQAAASAIPQGTTLTTGSYRPADYKAPPYNFFAPAPTGTYGTDLTVFNGTSANGAWLLYVQDDTPPDSGVINGGWTLNITPQPQIVGLGNQVIAENSSGSQAFTIGDDSPSGPSYRFGSSSTNSALIPSSGITFTGSGTNWNVNITPAANKFGTNLVTVYATNIDNAVASNTFLVTVQQVIYPPVILAIPDTNTLAGTAVTVPVVYSDVQVPNNQLSVTFQSSNPGLIPVSSISLVGNSAIQVTPAGASSGSSVITVKVSQPQNQYGLSTQTNFTVTVNPVSGLFGTNALITINDRAPATPYPSTVNVSGLAGTIVTAAVTISGLQHSYPSDISLLLVGPQGQQIVLMSRAGSGAGSAITNVNLTFDDNAAGVPPQTGVITSGSYKPTDYNGSLVFYAPVTGPYVTNLSVLKGTNPNGTWSLYVQDDLSPDSGQITGGWLLKLVTTTPVFTFVGPQSTPENTTLTTQFSVSSALTSGDKLTVTAAASNQSIPGLIASATVTGPGTNTATSRTLIVVPGANLPSMVTNGDGTATITLTATDGTNSSTLSVPLTVTYVNQAPTITGLNDQSIPLNGQAQVAFKVNDVDTPASNLTVTATSSPSTLGILSLTSNGNDQTLTFTPTNGVGQTTVSVVAYDQKTYVTNPIIITVTGAIPPVFGTIAPQTTIANVPVSVPLPITDAVINVTNLHYTGTSDNSAVVTNVSFSVVGTGVVAIVTPVTNAVGSANITITASDSVTNASTSFLLTVNQPKPMQLGEIADVTVSNSSPVSVLLPVTVGDVPITGLTFSGTSTNSSLVSGITFSYNGTSEVAVIHLVGNKSGTDYVTISVTDGFSTNSQSFALDVEISQQPKPATITIGVSGKQLTMTFSGAPNALYGVQASSDLKAWSEIATITADASGNASYTNSVSSSVPVQFYRAETK